MFAFAAGEARRLTLAVLLLGGCAGPAPHDLAAADDRAGATSVYSWLVEHEPAGIVAWNVAPDRLRALLPAVRVVPAASERPCAQALRARAAIVLIARAGGQLRSRNAVRRDYALSCGVSLYRDDAAVVVAPLP